MSSSTKSQQASIQQMGAIEKLNIFPILAFSYANGFAALFSGLFLDAAQRPPQYYRHVMYTIIRTICAKMSVRQMQVVSPPTDEVYAQLCKRKKVSPHSEVLEDGTMAHWIGSSKADKIIINFHGGGYVLPAGWAYMEFMWRLQKFLSKEGKDVAVLFLSYDLAPQSPYPRQLQQAASLFNHVLHNLQRSSSDIILTGDSAGGNLALALLSHITHPHPSASIPRVSLSAPLRGVVLTSPWLTFSSDAPAFQRNAPKDLLDLRAGVRWSAAFLGERTPAAHDSWNQPLMAPVRWWEEMPVQEVLIVAGADEVLVDDVVTFAATLREAFGEGDKKEGQGRVKLLVAEGEAHDMTNLDVQLGYREPGLQASLIRTWVASKL